MRRTVLMVMLISALMYIGFAGSQYFMGGVGKEPEFKGTVSEGLRTFAWLASAGPALDQDCVGFGGRPNKMDTELLEQLEVMRLPNEAGGSKVLVDEHAVFVGFAWKTSEATGVLMFCEFQRH